jgi:hypothetical protein
MKFRLAAATAATGIAAASTLLWVVPAAAQEEPPAGPLPLTVDPTSGSDALFTVSGTGCVGPQGPGAFDVFVDGSALTNDDPDNPDLADAEGNWSIDISPADPTVPLSPGVLEITATCSVNDASGTEIVEYSPATYEITGAPAPTPTAPPTDTPAPPVLVAPAAVAVVGDPDFTG